ncbi:hypothetical protein VTK56DRAFT_9668 [Thermocarpiscus australiensis]
MTTPSNQHQTTPDRDTPASSSSYLASLNRAGFVILRALLAPHELATLRAAAVALTATARAGGWPHVRTVGKQFPPWDASLVPHRAGIWGVQHLLHPDLPLQERAARDAFVRLYFDERLLRVVREVLGVDVEEHREGEDGDDGCLVMELLNMLVRPDVTGGGGDGSFSLRWHRDDIPPTATAEEEIAKLGVDGASGSKRYTHAQWNLALYDDDSLIVVPGSHARARTQAEREADPYEACLPGQVRVELKAGDVVFYDNNILHRGVYDATKERMTLHGSVGHVKGSRERARNVLQHGVGEWVDRCDFSALGDGPQRRLAEGMRRRLVDMGRENQGRDVGYSLEG